jgi:arginase
LLVRIAILGVPADLGAARRGTDMGPSAIRYAKLREQLAELGHDVVDLGNVHVPVPETRHAGDERLKYLPEIEALCGELADAVERAVRDGRLPLVLGGDHSLSMGTLAGLTRVRSDVGLLWMDAHGDFNTAETTPSGNIHGMPLAAVTGRGDRRLVELGGIAPKVRAEDAALVGVRELDPLERNALRTSGVKVFTMKEVDRLGIGGVMDQVLAHVASSGRCLHLSFDMDVIDPRYAPGVGTPVAGGLTYREAHLAMELLSDAGVLCSIEFVEVNPILDRGNETARLTVELAASALGKRIL